MQKTIKGLITRCRSCRRFYQNYKIKEATLKGLVEFARLSASAANLQPLKYILSCKNPGNRLIFNCLKWAAYLKYWRGPKEGERPSAYIIVLGDRSLSNFLEYDCGIATQSILLGAASQGLGGCRIASLDREILRKNLNIPGLYEILIVLALGRPKEKIKIEKARGSEIKYYRDKQGTHHVPKRALSDIIIKV